MPAKNAYQEDMPRKQPQHEMQPSAAEPAVYSNMVVDGAESYEYIEFDPVHDVNRPR